MSDGLRVFISVDMEGISGIVNWQQTGSAGLTSEYEDGRRLAASDLNAAIEGVLEAGVDDIVVRDAHARKTNIKAMDVNRAASLVRGYPRPYGPMGGFTGDYDAVLYVGYHARAGTSRAVLAHTWSNSIESIKMNDLEVGEAGLGILLAGYHDIPVIFVSGDDAVAREARELVPSITMAIVKYGEGWSSARCLPPQDTHQLIKEKSREAIENIERVEPLKLEPPIKVEVTLTHVRLADQVDVLPIFERFGGKTFKGVFDTIPEAYRAARTINQLTRGS
jgi:D-amino peptidase